MPRVEREQLFSSERAESSAAVRERVQLARKLQLMRQGKPNAQLGVAELGEHVEPKPDASQLLQRAMQKLGLSARGYHRILKRSEEHTSELQSLMRTSYA